jgi:hypothetical protein
MSAPTIKPLTRCSRFPGLDYINPVLTPIMGPWIKLPVRPYLGDEVRYRLVAKLYVRAQRNGVPTDTMAQDLLVLQVERRNAGLLDIYTSAYTSQILIGGLVDEEHAAELFDHESQSIQGLWCAECFTDDIYGNARGAVEIPYWMKGRYFSEMRGLPVCGTCGCQPQQFRTETPKEAKHAHLFSSVCNMELQEWVEEALTPQGIAAAKLTWLPGPVGTDDFKAQLFAKAAQMGVACP